MMRKDIVLKVSSISLLGFVAFFTTRGILAKSPQTRPTPKLTTFLAKVLPPGVRSQQTPGQLDRRVSAAYGMPNINCSPIGGGVHVSAEATAFDQRPDARSVWTFRIFDPGDTQLGSPLFEKVYENQVFFPAQLQNKPTFEDLIVLPLPPGDYIAELALSRVNPRDGLKLIRDPARSQREIHTARRRLITVN